MHRCLQHLRAFLIDKRGFTLVELLLVVALVGIVLAIPIQALFLTNRDWQYNQAMSPALMDGNLIFARLGNEIRAADKPSGGARAVEIDEGKLIIYRPNGNTWERIEYRLNDDSNQLQRGTFSGSEAEVLNREGNTVSWETIASSVTRFIVSEDNPESSADRRLIRVAMQISDTVHEPPSFQPFVLESSFLSRTQQPSSGSGNVVVIGPDGETIIPVNDVVLSQTHLVMRDSPTAELTAYVFPHNATNKAVTWSTSDSSVVTVDGDGLTVTITAHDYGEATITVTTVDGGFTADCKVKAEPKTGCGGS